MAAAAQNLPETPTTHTLPLLQRMGLTAASTREELQLQQTVLPALTLAGGV